MYIVPIVLKIMYLILICTKEGWHVISSACGTFDIFSLTAASSSPTLLIAAQEHSQHFHKATSRMRSY